MPDDITQSQVHWLEGAVKSPHALARALPPIAVTGSRGANAALASLLTALQNMGLVDDNTVV